jgi:histidinol phosphatase-like enzyme (inositol monophosphatase family)
MTQQALLQAVDEVARRAGEVAMRWYRRGVEVETKADGSPVTAADRAAEEFAREWISSRFPDDGVIGEELPAHRPDARRRWFVDPIDGTRSFVAGTPLWGTLVAVCEGDDVLAGAIACVAAGETVAAAINEGCWRDGSRCSVSTVSELARATVLTTDERFTPTPHRRDGWVALSNQANTSRTWGDCYGYLLVATGRAEVMVDGIMTPWDAAALLPVITEAGGVFVDYNGRPTAFGDGSIATNAALAQTAHSLLGVKPS